MNTITAKRADEIELGDRLSIPGTDLSREVRFIHRSEGLVLIELSNGSRITMAGDTELRVVAS